MDTEIHQSLDATGLLCPLPVLKARKVLKAMDPGQVLEILATDPGAVADFQSFCEVQQHDLVTWDENDERLRFLIRKG